MAVAVINEVQQGTLEMYDAVNEKVGGNLQEGQIVHSAGAMEGGGFRVFDVWESTEAYERFVEEKLGPAIAEVAQGQAFVPQRTMYELHNFAKT